MPGPESNTAPASEPETPMEQLREVARQYPDIGGPMLAAVEEVRAGMRLTRRIVIAAAVVLALALAWWFRWDMRPRDGYVLDRLTGAIYLLGSDEMTEVKKITPPSR